MIWALGQQGDSNLFAEYFHHIDTDIEVIINEEYRPAQKDVEQHSDSRLVIKNPLKSKEESKKFYDTFDRISVHGTIAKK